MRLRKIEEAYRVKVVKKLVHITHCQSPSPSLVAYVRRAAERNDSEKYTPETKQKIIIFAHLLMTLLINLLSIASS
jgi:hypothetical protein